MELTNQALPDRYIQKFRNIMGGGEKLLVFILAGKLDLLLGTQTSTLKAPALYLINNRQAYSLRGVSNPEAYTFQLSCSRHHDFHQFLFRNLSTEDIIMRHIPASKVGLFRYLIANENNSGIADPVYHQMLKLELRRLFTRDKISRCSKVVDHFQKLVGRHCRTERALAFYASHLCISENHLYKIVKQTTGRTPSGIIQEHLIQEAIFCLEYTDQSLKEIAFDLSFKEVAYFIRFFKKHTGTTPGQYRKSLIDQQDLSNDRQDMYYRQKTEGT